jgi:hypothetical protein
MLGEANTNHIHIHYTTQGLADYVLLALWRLGGAQRASIVCWTSGGPAWVVHSASRSSSCCARYQVARNRGPKTAISHRSANWTHSTVQKYELWRIVGVIPPMVTWQSWPRCSH